MHLILKLTMLTILLVGCSSEDKEVSQAHMEPAKATCNVCQPNRLVESIPN